MVVLLHSLKGNRKVWDDTAIAFQKKGIAALAVDLRGHGESKDQGARKIDAANFRGRDFDTMVTFDMEAVKRELVIRHNRGELNIERLGVVGAELGASIAVRWAGWDWTNAGGQRPNYTTIQGGKRGQDVKALALLSPEYNFQGLRITPAHVNLMKGLRVLVAAGEQRRSAKRQADRLYKAILNRRVKDDPYHEQEDYPTTMQGTDLLKKDVNPDPEKNKIVEFMVTHLQEELRDSQIAWQQRRTPFGLQPE